MSLDITADELRSVLFYDRDIGQFFWIKGPSHRLGKRAGTVTTKGRRQIVVNGRSYLEHRLAWLYVYGAWPKQQIDHMNGDPADNRIVNLRDVSTATNCENKQRAQSNSKTGILGVTKHKTNDKWLAFIRTKGKTIYLGAFKEANFAAQAYLNAKRKLHKGAIL